MNLTEEKDRLKSLDYDGVSVEICQAVFDTITHEKYKDCLVVTEDERLMDWIRLAQPVAVFAHAGQTVGTRRYNFVFIDGDVDIGTLPQKVKMQGQFVVHGANPVPLRALFNKPDIFEKWLTVELPLGNGLFIARRIA